MRDENDYESTLKYINETYVFIQYTINFKYVQ